MSVSLSVGGTAGASTSGTQTHTHTFILTDTHENLCNHLLHCYFTLIFTSVFFPALLSMSLPPRLHGSIKWLLVLWQLWAWRERGRINVCVCICVCAMKGREKPFCTAPPQWRPFSTLPWLFFFLHCFRCSVLQVKEPWHGTQYDLHTVTFYMWGQ